MTQVNRDSEHPRLLSIFHCVTGGLMALPACVPVTHVIVLPRPSVKELFQ